MRGFPNSDNQIAIETLGVRQKLLGSQRVIGLLQVVYNP
jgi:hypothetical protein